MASTNSIIDPKTWGLTISDVAKSGPNGETLLSPSRAAKAILKKMPIILVSPDSYCKDYRLRLCSGIWSDNDEPDDRVWIIVSSILDELVGDSATDCGIQEVMNRISRILRFRDECERLDECNEIANEIEAASR
jgi:hypothetical protein